MIGSKMTGKERLTCLFEGKEIDRVPIWLLFPYHPISCYVDVYRLASYAQVLEAANKYADVLDRREFEKISLTMQKNYIRFIEAGYKYGKYV